LVYFDQFVSPTILRNALLACGNASYNEIKSVIPQCMCRICH